LTTVGYGDVIPTESAERCYATLSMVIAGAFYGYLIGMIGSTIATQDRNAAAYSERMEEIRSWLFYHSDLPKTLRKRIKHYFQKRLTQKAAIEDSAVIDHLSPALLHDVSFFLIPEQVRCNALFSNLPNSALVEILPILDTTDIEAHDQIVSHGDPGTSMYVITDGFAFIDLRGQTATEGASNGTEIKKKDKRLLKNGDSFGEEIILGLSEDYYYTVVARSPMQLCSLEVGAFSQAFHNMPELLGKIKENYFKTLRRSEHMSPVASILADNEKMKAEVEASPEHGESPAALTVNL